MTSDYSKTRRTLVSIAVEAVALEKDLSGSVADYVCKWLAGQYATVAEEQLKTLEGEERLKLMRQLVHDCSLLRKGDHNTSRLEIEREWLALSERDSFSKYKRKIVLALETLIKNVNRNEATKAAFATLGQHFRHPYNPDAQDPGKNFDPGLKANGSHPDAARTSG